MLAVLLERGLPEAYLFLWLTGCWLCCWQEACLTDVTAALRRYCWGNESTPMGNKRAADGHPDQYQLKYIELGCAFPLGSCNALVRLATPLGASGR